MVIQAQQLLQHGYTTTVVLYPFKKRLAVAESHIMSTGDEPTHMERFTATCIIHNGRIIEESFETLGPLSKTSSRNKEKEKERECLYWNMTEISKSYQKDEKKKGMAAIVSTLAENFKLQQEGNGSRSETKEDLSVLKTGDFLFVKSYMAELYKLFQKANVHSKKDEKNKVLLEKSFSKALKKAMVKQDRDHKASYANEESSNFTLETEKKVDKNHYVVVVPTDWSEKVAKDILRPIFINAGLITEGDPPCRLTFVDKLYATFYSFQKCLSDTESRYWIEYGTLNKNKNYALFEMDFDHYSDKASINCFLFQTGNTNSMINGIEGLKPYGVANFGKLNLVSIGGMKKSLLDLLIKKKIIPPSSEFMRAEGSKAGSDVDLNFFLEILLINITTNYYWVSKKKYESDLINKGEKRGSPSQMSSQYPFRSLWIRNYRNFTEVQLKQLEEISMEELYNIIFRDNEVNIKKCILDCFNQYKNTTLQGAIIVLREPSKNEHSIYNFKDLSWFKERDWCDFKEKYSRCLERGDWITPELHKLSQKYMDSQYLLILSQTTAPCTEKYFSFAINDSVEKVRYFEYSDIALAEDLLFKTKDDVKKALNLLPPSVIQYPEFKYNSMLESTEKSCPSRIINIDLTLHCCKYSHIQINKNLKVGTKIDHGNEIKSIVLTSLDSFINIKFLNGAQTNAFLHISQETFDRMLALIKRSTHIQAVLQFFFKYNRSKSSSFNQQTTYKKLFNQLFLWYSSSSSLVSDSFSPTESALLLPAIKELFESQDNISREEGLIAIYCPSYVMTFMVIYFIYLHHKIGIHLKDENHESAVGEISYVISVDRILLEKCLMGSKSTLKKLLLASGLTSKPEIRKQLRIITQGECLFPVLQQKANLDLPLKSYYIHAQLYETSIQMSLNQVVVKGNPESTPMTIVVKNNTIPIKNLHELLCDNLWNQIQSNCHQSLCEEHQVDENGNLEEREYSMADRLEFEKTFMRYVKELSPLKQSIESRKLEIPNDRSFCDCSIYLTHDDIVELSIKPVLKTIVSSILGALTNDQVFGEYYMSALFVTFDSILDSIFHHSYKQTLKSILEKTIKIRLEAKQLEIPNFILFLNSDINSSVEATRNSAFNNLFSEGSLLQVSSATYLLRFRDVNDGTRSNYVKPKVYIKDPKNSQLKCVAKDDAMVTILRRGDTLSKEEGIKKTYYIRFLKGDFRSICVDLFECGPRIFKSSTGGDVENRTTEADTSLSFAFSTFSEISRGYGDTTNVEYVPLYITIKPIGYQSLINISFEFGNQFHYYFRGPNVIDMGDPLTLKNTQYVPQVKK